MNDKITMQQILNIRYIAMFLRNGVVKIVSNVKIAICACNCCVDLRIFRFCQYSAC